MIRENTNINIQDVKNDICISEDEGVSGAGSYSGLGVIGYMKAAIAHDPSIVETTEINNVTNDITNDISEENSIGKAVSYIGAIGFIEATTERTNYTNDKCSMYSINSNISTDKTWSYEIGAGIGYIGNKNISEYKINNMKAKVDFGEAYYASGAIGMGYPGESSRILIENFDVEITQTKETSSSYQVGGVIGYLAYTTNSSDQYSTGSVSIKNGKGKVDFKRTNMAGGIVGEVYNYNLSISNVIAQGKMQGDDEIGGIAGYAYAPQNQLIIENAKNYVDITEREGSSGDYNGGIVGYLASSYASIKNAVNYGTIYGKYDIGGIVGSLSTSTGALFIENVHNYGDVTNGNANYGDSIGGIIGYGSGSYVNIKNAKNHGKIIGYCYAGGIVGRQSGNRIELLNCENMGEISGDRLYEYAGGLFGTSYASTQIENSYNKGNIKLVGENQSDCYYVGGLIGYQGGSNECTLTINNSYNEGNITILGKKSTYEIGGLAGWFSPGVIQNSYNAGNINIDYTGQDSGYAYAVGGIGSSSASSGLINNVINKGNIQINSKSEHSTSSNIGGILGCQGQVVISNAVNQGEIEIFSNGVDYYSVGGISGEAYENASINNAYNTGNITLLGGEYRESNYIDKRGLGGIVGTSQKGAIVNRCYNSGKIVSMIFTGGIVGYNKGTVVDCYNEGKITSYKKMVGGIAGKNEYVLSNVYNVGNVTAKNDNVKIGPIAGESSDGLDYDGNILDDIIENAHYSDKVTIVGGVQNQDGTKQEDRLYEDRTEFYNTLNTYNAWTYIDDQYPKLMISAGETIPETTELNIINDHKIYNISTMLNNSEGGSITGYGQDVLEEVRHGASNTKAIEMIPNEGYEIGRVTINGEQQEITLNADGSYKIGVGELQNIKDDKLIYVEFLKQDQILLIEKVDKDTDETLSNATFDIQQIENSPITDEVSELKESNVQNENAADVENLVDETIGNPTMSTGSYSKNNGVYTLNSAYYRYQSGRYWYAISGRIPINLSDKTGKYIVRFESEYWDSASINNSNGESVGYMESYIAEGSQYSYTYLLTGGQSYYVQLYRDQSGSTFSRRLDNFHVYPVTDKVYNMTTTDEGYYETTNANVPWAISAGNVEIDLTNHPEEHTISFKHKSVENSNREIEFDIIVKNSITDAKVYEKTVYALANEQTGTINVPGGTKYKLEFRYKNLAGNAGKLQITGVSVALDESKLTKVTRTSNVEGQIKVQLPVGKYRITETTAPEHYLLNTESTEYYVDINKENKVTIQDTHKPIVRVHHYLMENGQETTKKVAADEEYEGNLNEDYYFNPKDKLVGLSLAKDDNGELIIPSNYKGKYTLGVTDVNFYYEADNIKLTIHHYQEGTQTKVADDEVIEKDAVVEFKQDGSYKVSATGTYKVADNAKYQELTASTYNLTSLYSSVHAGLEIGDTLEYSSNAELIYNYSTKKYRIVTRVIEHEEVVPDEKEDDEESEETNPMTNTTSNEITNTTTNETTDENTTNGTTNTTENTTTNTETTPKTKTISVKGGTISGYDLEYYEELASNANSTKDIIVTPDKGYKIKEIKLNDNVVYDADHTTSDLYTVENGVVTFNKFNNVIEDKTITVEFEGVGSIVKVHHIITEEGKEDVEYKTVEIRGKVGSRYTTEEIEIEGYTLYSTSLNTTGEIAEDQIDVYYNYKANPETTYTIRYFYDNTEDVELAERIVGKTKTTVTMEDIQAKIDEHKKDVYEFERAENIPLMIVNDVDEYVVKIYYISTFGKVVEKHIDAGHNTLLYTETHKGSIGTAYNIKSRKIDGYTLLEKDMKGKSILPTNAEGTYTKDVIDTVIYYYTRNTTVKVIYQDENETELDKVIIEGHEGDEYTTEEKTIKGYELVETPKNAEGVMIVTKDADGNDNTETVVTYKYKKLVPADVVREIC